MGHAPARTAGRRPWPWRARRPGPDLDDLIRKAQDWLRSTLFDAGRRRRRQRPGDRDRSASSCSASGRPAASTGCSRTSRAWCCASAPTTARDQPGPELPHALADRDGADPARHPREPGRSSASAPATGAAAAPAPRRDVLEESLMLTGDENIIDIDFVVLLARSATPASSCSTPATRRSPSRSAAESVMREVIGHTPIQPALTEARGQIETQVPQRHPGDPGRVQGRASTITQVQLQKVDPPAAVDRRLPRRAARRAPTASAPRNEAEAYRNDIIPRARGEAERMIQEAQGYREQTRSARAQVRRQRFISVLERLPGRPRTSPRGACISRPWRRSCGATTRSSSTTGWQGLAPFPTCR